MARQINRLSPRAVATLTKRGRYADGGGLYLQVSAYDTKAWIFRYTISSKSREMGLGPLHTVSLAEAREAARECRKMIREGLDPISQRRAEKAARKLQDAQAMTFRQCAEAYIRSHSGGWRNIKHTSQWGSTLKTYAYPIFGDVSVDAVDTAMVVKAIEPIWTSKTETATRVRGRIEAILDWAKASGYRHGENPARWRGHISNLLPKPSKVAKVKHFAALPYDEIGAFMVKLRERGAIAARGLEFLILTAARTSEVLGARWDEIDFAGKLWVVSADRMKSDKEHRVPLSADALTVLQSMSETRQSDFIFPGQRPKGPLSNMVRTAVQK
jgi:integrase